jgi:hypothetical protein
VFFRDIDHRPLVTIPEGSIGVVTSHVGEPSELATAPYSPHFGDFTDVEAFLEAGGRQGVQEAVLPPGTYQIHPQAFEVIVLDSSDETYRAYGKSSPLTDAMSCAEPNAVRVGDKTVVAVYPDVDDTHATLAMLRVGTPSHKALRVMRALTSPLDGLTIEWELAAEPGYLPNEHQVIVKLNQLVTDVFGTSAVSVAEFVAKVRELEAAARKQHCCVRVTEAVFLPRLAITAA